MNGRKQAPFWRRFFFVVATIGFVGLGFYYLLNPVLVNKGVFYHVWLGLFLVGIYGYLHRAILGTESIGIAPIFRNMLLLGLAAVAMLSPNLWGINQTFAAKTADIFGLVQALVLYIYAVASAMWWIKVITHRRDSLVVFISNLYLVFLGISIPLSLLVNVLPEGFEWGIMTVRIILVFVLSTRFNWLAFLKPGDRTQVLLLHIGIIVVNLLLLYAVLGISEGVLPPSDLYGSYFYLLIFAANLRSVISFLGLVFYLPISSVVDQQAQEIRSLVEISGYGKGKANIQGLFDQLISSAINDTRSDAGWLELHVAGGDGLLKTRNINIREVDVYDKRIDKYKQSPEMVLDIPALSEEKAWQDLEVKHGALLAIDASVNEHETLRLCLLKEDERGFDPYSLDIIKAYLGQARTAYENYQLFQDALLNERVKEEVEIAKRIQQSLIPKAFPHDERIEITSLFEPSRVVGGDFYDFFQISEHKTAIIIGDVSGKGIPAALHMAEIKGIFQTLHQNDLSPKEILLQANKAISACFEKNVFVSLIYLVLDRKKRTFSYARAGHCPLLFFDNANNTTNYFEDRGLGLGIIRNESYEGHIFVYEKPYFSGDILLLFTDGLDEGADPKSGTIFGYEQISKSLASAARSGSDVRKTIMADFKRHVKNNENLDDLALIVVKFK